MGKSIIMRPLQHLIPWSGGHCNPFLSPCLILMYNPPTPPLRGSQKSCNHSLRSALEKTTTFHTNQRQFHPIVVPAVIQCNNSSPLLPVSFVCHTVVSTLWYNLSSRRHLKVNLQMLQWYGLSR